MRNATALRLLRLARVHVAHDEGGTETVDGAHVARFAGFAPGDGALLAFLACRDATRPTRRALTVGVNELRPDASLAVELVVWGTGNTVRHLAQGVGLVVGWPEAKQHQHQQQRQLLHRRNVERKEINFFFLSFSSKKKTKSTCEITTQTNAL